MTIAFEPDDALVLDRESLASTVRVAILYIFHRLRDGVRVPHPDRCDDSWYDLFMEDVKRARRLRRLLEVLDPSEKKESGT